MLADRRQGRLLRCLLLPGCPGLIHTPQPTASLTSTKAMPRAAAATSSMFFLSQIAIVSTQP